MRIRSRLCRPEDTCTSVHLRGQSNRLRSETQSHKQHSFHLTVPGKSVIRGPSPYGAFVISAFVVLLVLGKPGSSSACQVSDEWV